MSEIMGLDTILQNIIDAARDGSSDNRVSRELTREQALNIYKRGREIQEEDNTECWYKEH